MRTQLNLPNAITLFRIFLVPVLVVVILTRFEGREWVGIGVFLLASFSDWLDGWLARRRQQVTALGKLLDPMADKLLVAGAFISLIEVGAAPAWMVVIIMGREFLVTGLRGVAAERGLAIAATGWGKAKMVTQVVCIVALLLGKPGVAAHGILAQVARPVGVGLLWLTVVVTVVSGVTYFVAFRRVFETDEGAPGERGETE